MTTVALSTTPATLNPGTAYELDVVNSGSTIAHVQIAGGLIFDQRINPGQTIRVQPNGQAVTAFARSGSGQVTTTSYTNPEASPSGAFPSRAGGSTAAAASLPFFNIRDYGAVGNGVSDDTAAIQAAVTAAAAVSGTVLAPSGTYKVSSTIMGGDKLILRGASKHDTKFVATSALTGYVISTTGKFDVSDLSITGTSVDGVYGFGGTSGNSSGSSIRRVSIDACDYGIRFAGTWMATLKLDLADIYVYGFRTVGIMLATGGTSDSGSGISPTDGQNSWRLSNVVSTNGGTAPGHSLGAAGFAQTNNSPDSTHDALSWTGSDATEVGYVIMRRPTGDANADHWEWVDYVGRTATSYSAVKTAGLTYDYRVQRRSTAIYLRHIEGLSITGVQPEYCATGLWLREVKGAQVSAFYSEWRGMASATPTCRGDGVFIDNSSAVAVQGVWAEMIASAVSVASSTVSVDAAVVNNCQRSAVHYASTNAGFTLTLGNIDCTGTTPTPLTTSGSSFDSNIIARNRGSADRTAANRLHVDHTTVAEFEADFRGVRGAALGSDGQGYAWLSTASLPTASSAYDGQIRRLGSQLYICSNASGTGSEWLPFASQTRYGNAATTFVTGKRTDGTSTVSLGHDGNGNVTTTPSAATRDLVATTGGFRVGAAGPMWRAGTGSPEGILTAPVGSLWTRTDGGASTTLYVKESGVGNTGWIAK